MMDERLHSLDQLGDALQRHQSKPDRENELDRPAYETSSVRRSLVDAPGVDEPWPREIDEDNAKVRNPDELDIGPIHGAADNPPQFSVGGMLLGSDIVVAAPRLG